MQTQQPTIRARQPTLRPDGTPVRGELKCATDIASRWDADNGGLELGYHLLSPTDIASRWDADDGWT